MTQYTFYIQEPLGVQRLLDAKEAREEIFKEKHIVRIIKIMASLNLDEQYYFFVCRAMKTLDCLL